MALGEPLAVPLGVLIALAEIAIGLGALTSLLARWCAWGGVALAALLWLTASWAVHPYYLGPDLPYLAGWLTLALVGDGGILSFAALSSDGGASHTVGSTGLTNPACPGLGRTRPRRPIWSVGASSRVRCSPL